ncbi:MAG TPA: glycosyltransferase family 39 protein [Pyrinomonadaceae bacterium]|nr:glycosyltransferase family 39 protein [Pyrinomonadaceae bacterium]
MHTSNLAKRGTVLLFLAVIAFYFYGLGHFPLLGPDEPRYAQVAREMFLRHDLITPTLGGHLWFEKPALLYWMMIGSFKLFGVTEWAARAPSALAGVLTIAAVFVVARQATRSDQDEESHDYVFWCSLVSASTLGIAVFSRAASFDIILTMTTTWALAFYLLYEFAINEKRRRFYLAGFYAFIGLSLLAKGLIGIVIPFGVIAVYHLLERRLPKRTALISLLWGLPLALIVAGVWYAPVIQRHGWVFIDQFFIQHHFARYISDKYHHHAPFYYYLMILPLLALPWTAFLIDGLLQTKNRLARTKVIADDSPDSIGWERRHPACLNVRDRVSSRQDACVPSSRDGRLNSLLLFSFAWILFPLVFFSLSSSKLPGYMLPSVPAAAFIVGERIWRLSLDSRNKASLQSLGSRWTITTTATFCVLFAVATLVYARRTGNLELTSALVIATPVLIAGLIPLLVPGKTAASIISIAVASGIALIVALNVAAPAFADRQSSKRLLQLADARGYSQAPVYGLQRDERSPEFYAAGRVTYEPDGEPTMYEGIGQVVWESRRRQETILTMARPKDLQQFRELSSMRVDVVGDNGKIALVAVGPP